MTRTPWYSARDHKPVRVGWYECQYHPPSSFRCMRWWNGRHWLLSKYQISSFGTEPGDRWRGLTEEHRD